MKRKLRPKIEKKQKAGRRLARWFVPANRVDLAIRDFVMRMAAWPITSHLLRFTFSPESVNDSRRRSPRDFLSVQLRPPE